MPAKTEKVWRSVGGEAILCSDCAENRKQVLYGGDKPIGITYHCNAKDEICVFLKKKIDSQETYDNWQDIVKPEDLPDDKGKEQEA